MPPRRSTKPASASAADDRHDATRLKNLAGLADGAPWSPVCRTRYEYDPRRDPQLQRASVATVPLHIYERIAPAAIIDSRVGPVQLRHIDASIAEQIAVWLLDSNYAGATFQPSVPWTKSSKVRKSGIDPEQFAALQRTESLPFKVGKHKRCVVKVIDHRGNEVMTVLRLQ